MTTPTTSAQERAPLRTNCKSIKIYSDMKERTELSNLVWENKHANTETSSEWKILGKACLSTKVKKVHAMSNREIPHPFLKA